ncbi:osteopetrosis associated transmembrane [Schistosoma japonicum]|nr:osteopetrosis associated transmembrane [Schistosoma japonicum]
MEHTNSLKAVILVLGILLKMYSSLKNSSTEVNDVCIEYRENVSIYVKDIIYNMSTKTAPVSYCGWCSETVHKLRIALEEHKAYNSDGTACVDLLANTEKGTIDSVDFIFDKWNRSFCSHCLEGSSNQNIGKLADSSHNIECSKHHLCMDSLYNLKVYNDKVRTFFDKLDDVLSCFMRFINNSNISILNVLNFPSPSTLNITSMVCQNCSVAYYSLLDFYTNTLLRYNSLDGWHQNVYSKEYSSYRFAVCLDVQNAVNRTQWAWHNLFKCRTEEISPIGFFLPLLVCIVFLIIFHSLAQSVCRYPVHLMVYRPKRVEPTVRSQQRLLSTSSVTRGQMSLIRSYGSIRSVVENSSMDPNIITKHYSHPDSLFDNRTILLQTTQTSDQ